MINKIFFIFKNKKMLSKQKLKLVKKLETLVLFQKDCLDKGNWEDYDIVENEIEKIEENLASLNNVSLISKTP
ncbi:MAG: hypothetical protein COZ85_03655 [Candidatus Moranbacteria bacterium CG_4_8_14_3_um_filter_34_16]|nr:MAG: hypothetical protein COT31_03860 [Candidatus Moranbacteria bacterium CG08_land_8_20_14_0_20_34_16]PIW94720.1 MAG: hypothetical protein COZ85_03655 [Candidatus Moranbacteria bacterium CG_4_8_14_3_um_filter_34_16]PJA89468.1 MAG: hypothetical protein CO138_00290 [Candidatus Moranbacteria bacterium CG_4_9_14_3_um_filter_33_15]